MISNKEYQEFTETTAIYPPEEALTYLFTNTAAEAGELAGKYAKAVRDGWSFEQLEAAARVEAGDVLWGISQLCNEFGWTFEQLMEENKAKLEDRMKRDVISGEGDYR